MRDPQLSLASRHEFFRTRSGYGFWVGSVVLLALLVREYFVLVAIVDNPIRGDIREYVHYAWNLYHHGVFSITPPQPAAPVPDAYRSPGYPGLLALCMRLRPQDGGWYALALQMQVLLGTATVWLTMLLARYWLGQRWTIAAGLLLAVWPHHVAATGALLSEVVFAFALMAGLYCLVRAMRSDRHGVLVLAALIFGYAYLVNPVIALFPPIAALLVWREQGRGKALLFTTIFLVPLIAWGVRAERLADSDLSGKQPTSRAITNLVQGSWPEYHWAWQARRFGDPVALSISREIDNEIALLQGQPATGISIVTRRLVERPVYYALWYVWRKPLLLWDWNIRIGPGGVYVLEVEHSPLKTHPLLRWCSLALESMNPLLSLLALGGMFVLLAGGLREKIWAPPAALATSALALYLTAIHVVFQAEPRYANAYRGIEMLLITTALSLLADSLLRMRRNGARVPPAGEIVKTPPKTHHSQ